jgi:hypothetical protein
MGVMPLQNLWAVLPFKMWHFIQQEEWHFVGVTLSISSSRSVVYFLRTFAAREVL